jgi:hypothetical protein
MNKLLLTAVLVAVTGLPSITVAQTASQPLMDPKTIICRPAGPGETSNATIKKTPVMCHKINVARVTAALNELSALPLSASQRTRVNKAMDAMKTEMTLKPKGTAPGTNHIPGYYDTSEY